MVHTGLLSSAEYQLLAPSARTVCLATKANAFLDAGTRPQLASRFAALCEQASVRARPMAPPPEVPALLDALWALAYGCDNFARSCGLRGAWAARQAPRAGSKGQAVARVVVTTQSADECMTMIHCGHRR
jgi:hypothetical protein